MACEAQPGLSTVGGSERVPRWAAHRAPPSVGRPAWEGGLGGCGVGRRRGGREGNAQDTAKINRATCSGGTGQAAVGGCRERPDRAGSRRANFIVSPTAHAKSLRGESRSRTNTA